jgi:hypothetical protein
MELPELAREFLWLWERRGGAAVVTIARRDRTSLRAVREGIARAEAAELAGTGPVPVVGLPPDRERGPATEPRLEPLFPVLHFVPESPCPHYGTIRRGSSLVCMVCHKSGLDHLGILQRPAEKKKAKAKARPKAEPKLTRKQRRAQFFADRKNRAEGKG